MGVTRCFAGVFSGASRKLRHARRRIRGRASLFAVERFEERWVFASAGSLHAPAMPAATMLPAVAVITTTTAARESVPSIAAVTQPFQFGFRHINEVGADRYLVESTGMRRYSEWQAQPITYWGPIANNVEGRLVYKFPFAAPSQSARLLASSPSWDYFREPGGVGRGASALEVSADGVAWTSLRNSLEPRQWGLDWSYDAALPASVLGRAELWVRMRFLVEASPNTSYTNTQFGRSTATNTAAVFQLEASFTGNQPPSTIQLSAASLAENAVAGTLVGTVQALDPDVGNSFSYQLVSGAGGGDNAAFTIVGNQLRSRQAFDFEQRPAAAIRLRATDQGGLFVEKSFTIQIRDLNERPTNVDISSATLSAGNAIGAVVGTLSARDQDVGDRHRFSLVPGPVGNDNALFRVEGNQLRAAASLSDKPRAVYTARVRATDAGGLSFDRDIQITVTPVTSRFATLSRLPGEGYARLVQGGIYLAQGQTYRFTIRMLGTVTLQGTDHIPEFWGNGRIFDGTGKRSWVQGDSTYLESTVVAPVSGFYELKLALWSRQSLSVSEVSLQSLSSGVELVRNGRFADGLLGWYTHGGRAVIV